MSYTTMLHVTIRPLPSALLSSSLLPARLFIISTSSPSSLFSCDCYFRYLLALILRSQLSLPPLSAKSSAASIASTHPLVQRPPPPTPVPPISTRCYYSRLPIRFRYSSLYLRPALSVPCLYRCIPDLQRFFKHLFWYLYLHTVSQLHRRARLHRQLCSFHHLLA